MQEKTDVEKFEDEKKRIIKIAKELFYKPIVIDKLKQATTSNELSKIMWMARNEEI